MALSYNSVYPFTPHSLLSIHGWHPSGGSGLHFPSAENPVFCLGREQYPETSSCTKPSALSTSVFYSFKSKYMQHITGEGALWGPGFISPPCRGIRAELSNSPPLPSLSLSLPLFSLQPLFFLFLSLILSFLTYILFHPHFSTDNSKLVLFLFLHF